MVLARHYGNIYHINQINQTFFLKVSDSIFPPGFKLKNGLNKTRKNCLKEELCNKQLILECCY